MDQKIYKQLETLKAVSPEYKKLIENAEKEHFNYLSIGAHEILNKISFIASTHQLITLKHPEVCDFSFWAEMGSTINEFVEYLGKLSLCRYIHSPKFSEVNLDDILYSLHDYMEEAFPDNNNELIYNIHKSFIVSADYDHLKECFQAIIANACEADNQNNSIITITANETLLNNSTPAVSIEIINKGLVPDINEASMCKMFYTTKEHHTGIGLYVANTVCQRHHGSFTIKNECDSTIATITLPCI